MIVSTVVDIDVVEEWKSMRVSYSSAMSQINCPDLPGELVTATEEDRGDKAHRFSVELCVTAAQ